MTLLRSDWQLPSKRSVPDVYKANILASKDNFQEALQNYKECFGLFKKVYPNELHRGISSTFNDLANVCISFKKFDLAKEYIEKSMYINSKLFGGVSVELSTNYHTLGNMFSKEGNLVEAEKAYNKAIEASNLALGTEDTTDSATTLFQLAMLKQKKHDLKTAKELLEKSKTIFLKIYKGQEKRCRPLQKVEKELERLLEKKALTSRK